MTQAQCSFYLSPLPDGSTLTYECILPKVPTTNDIVAVTGISDKPYTTIIARVRRVGLILDISDPNTHLYSIILELLQIPPINTPYEIVRRL